MTKDTTLDIIANLHKEIEDFLTRTTHRQTFTSGEIQDFLLDLRGLSSKELQALHEVGHEVGDAATLAASVETGNQTGAFSEPDPTVN